MEQEKNTPTSQAQQPQEDSASAQPSQITEPIHSTPSSRQPEFQPIVTPQAPASGSPAVEQKLSSSLVYGLLSVGLGVLGYMLPYISLFLSSASYATNSSGLQGYYIASGVVAVLGVFLAAKALRSGAKLSLTGLAGFVLNIGTLMVVLSQAIVILKFNDL